MTDVPQPNTEAARPKGLDGVHWLPGPYILISLSLSHDEGWKGPGVRFVPTPVLQLPR